MGLLSVARNPDKPTQNKLKTSKQTASPHGDCVHSTEDKSEDFVRVVFVIQKYELRNAAPLRVNDQSQMAPACKKYKEKPKGAIVTFGSLSLTTCWKCIRY